MVVKFTLEQIRQNLPSSIFAVLQYMYRTTISYFILFYSHLDKKIIIIRFTKSSSKFSAAGAFLKSFSFGSQPAEQMYKVKDYVSVYFCINHLKVVLSVYHLECSIFCLRLQNKVQPRNLLLHSPRWSADRCRPLLSKGHHLK